MEFLTNFKSLSLCLKKKQLFDVLMSLSRLSQTSFFQTLEKLYDRVGGCGRFSNVVV